MIFSVFCLLSLVSTGAYAQIPSVFPGFPPFPTNTNPISPFVNSFLSLLPGNNQQLPPIPGLQAGQQIVSSFLAPFLNPNGAQSLPTLPFIRPGQFAGQFFPGINSQANGKETTGNGLASAVPNPIPVPNAETLQQVFPGAVNLPGSNNPEKGEGISK